MRISDRLKQSRWLRLLTYEEKTVPCFQLRGSELTYVNPAHVDAFQQAGISTIGHPYLPVHSRERRWLWQRWRR